MDYYVLTIKKTFQDLKTSINGLTEKETKERLIKYGQNQFEEKKPASPYLILLSQFKNFLILLLCAAFVISLFSESLENSIVLLVVILLNVLMGFILEYKAEKSLEKLKKIFSFNAVVIREGKQKIISSSELVPGDIVLLSQGDRIPADLRLIEEKNLEIDESSLTGESVPSQKDPNTITNKTALIDQKNMAFSGTLVTKGNAKGIVIRTGKNTEFGKIASSIQTKEGLTPLQKRLNYLGKILGVLSIGIVIIIFIIGSFQDQDLLHLFNYSIALLVSAVPESLPTIVTLALAIGVIKMSKEKAIIRKLPAVETLASIDVICSDKTGTLTKNEMTVKKIWAFKEKKEMEIKGSGYEPSPTFKTNSENILELIKTGYLCNNAYLTNDNNSWKIIGDPTEGAFLTLGEKSQINKLSNMKGIEEVMEIPFEEQRKMMSKVFKKAKEFVIYTKGAPEEIIKICNLSKKEKEEILAKVEKLASEGFRVLGLASSIKLKLPEKSIEKDLTFLGLAAMIDPPIPEVKESIEICKKAHIKPIMITGDHSITAKAIGKELGLFTNNEKILTGEELENLSENELTKIIDNVSIFARTSPSQKEKILTVLKKKKHLVAMTGDGVNDAPAIKYADIGIAMGIRGQDIAKEVADIVLTDDKFTTIQKAIEYARTIYDNIKKFLIFLLSSNFDELFLVAIMFIIGFPQPFTALQILWINLITDSFPALALAFENPNPKIMENPPKDPEKSFIKDIVKKALGIGAMALIANLVIFFVYLPESLVKARTMVFTLAVMFELIIVFAIRSETPFWKGGIFSNKYLNGAFIISLLLQLAVIYTPLSKPFDTIALGIMDWVYILGICMGCFLVLEGLKILPKRKKI